LNEPASFVDEVASAARRFDVGMVIPIGEPAALLLLGAPECLPGITIPFPDLATFRTVCDKEAVLAAARQLGIAVPEQAVAESPTALLALAEGPLRYPLVAKPARSVASAQSRGLRKHGVRHARDPERLRALASELPESAYPVLLQQRIVGPGTGIFLLRWDGEPRAVFAHRRLREKPPSGGVSVYSESIAADPELVARSLALLEALRWQGVAMVEYKRDAASGTPYLMEINGRFWGSLQLAIDSGVDFPGLLVECASGRAPAGPTPYRTGRRLRWLWGDVDHLLMRMRRSAEILDLPPDAPGRGRVAWDFATSWRPGQRCEPWRLDDLRPGIVETLAYFGVGPRALRKGA
jgi:predicted ATP-grasp superfamily ATP-dependent carboligase